jgi:hypothetical protein
MTARGTSYGIRCECSGSIGGQVRLRDLGQVRCQRQQRARRPGRGKEEDHIPDRLSK